MLGLGGVVGTIAALCVGESGIVFFFGSRNFGTGCRFPFVHGVRDVVSIQGFTVDSFAQALPEANNSAFGVEGPAGREGQSFKGGNVSVDIPPRHGELHELVVHVLFLGRVCPGVMERRFKLGPEDFVVFSYVVRSGGIGACY